MTIKVTYNVTDVYMSQSVSPVYINVSYSDGGASGGGVWGSITGTLSNQTDLQTALDLKVPYSGATGNVNLGEYELKAGQVTLDTSPTGTAAVGTIRWNDTTGTSETTLKGGNVIIKNGVDLVARVVNKVSPNTTLTKAAYQAVRVSGAQGQRLAIELAQANNDAGSADTIGLVTETIAPNQEGFIMTVGQLEGINTTGSLQGETWVDGDVLYLSPTTAGAITNVKPTGATGHLVIIGYVEYAHANNGKLYVKVANGFELDELHNVSIVTPTNNQGLFYNSSNSLWENKTISTALGYTPVPTTRNITINGVTYDLSADRTWTIATGISGSGASGQVTYWTGASAVSGSNNLFWDNTNGRLRINGSTSPLRPLEVFNSGNWISATFSGSGGTPKVVVGNLSGNPVIGGHNDALTGWAALAINPDGGNVLIGTSTNGSQKLQVIGDTLLRGSGATSATTALTVQNSSSVNMLRLLNDNTLKIGSQNIDIFPTADGSAVSNAGRGLIISTSAGTQTTGAVKIVGSSTLASGNDWSLWLSHSFAPASGTATHSGLLLNQTINQTGGANGITRGLYVNPTLTAAADWRSIEWSNNTGWGLYGAGTAANYLAGNLGLGALPSSWYASGTSVLQVRHSSFTGQFSGSDYYTFIGNNYFQDSGTFFRYINNGSAAQYRQFNGQHIWYSAPTGTAGAVATFTQGMTLDASGNLGIGITPTVRLHVSGDTILRGSGATSATTALTVQNSSSVNILQVLNNGYVRLGNLGNSAFRIYSSSVAGGGDVDLAGEFLTLNSRSGTTDTSSGGFIHINGVNASATSGTQNVLSVQKGFAPTSGNAVHTSLIVNPNINQTGGANGITRGLYVNPTLTSAADFRAIETTNGKIVFGNLPTSSAGLPTGALWNDAGTVKIV